MSSSEGVVGVQAAAPDDELRCMLKVGPIGTDKPLPRGSMHASDQQVQGKKKANDDDGCLQSAASSASAAAAGVDYGKSTDAAQALQASAAAARAVATQAAAPAPALAPTAGRSTALEAAMSSQQFAPPVRSRLPMPAQTAAAHHPMGVDHIVDDVLPASASGIPSMDITARYKRAWSIQEALDQHSALCRQKDNLAKIGANRVRVRRTQLQFAKLEVEDALERTRFVSPADAADAGRTQALAAHIRRVSHDFAMAQRLRTVDESVVQQHIAVAEEEIEKSRLEMKIMKQAIDDKSLSVATDDVPPEVSPDRKLRYCTNCKVGGHGQRFCEYLLKRPDWRVYPHQKWFEDEKHNEYHCPLGKRLVDFADESHFSRLAMYIKGRVWLEDKTKMWQLVPDLMPDTFVIDDMKWRDGRVPLDKEGEVLPWFVKEADRNWGTSVAVCAKASQCMELAKPGATYVVQQHIKAPLCMDDGRKCHIKFYVLLVGMEDGKTWNLYTFKEGYLSISPHRWSPDDLSKETQVTIIRSERIGSWRHWEAAYPKCKAGVAEVIRRGVAQGKLEGRAHKRQFEILSSDFIVDENGEVWLFEFNMSPVLKDPQDSPVVHDADMITAALDIVVPHEGSKPGLWDFAGEFVGEPPAPKAQVDQGAAKGTQPADQSGTATQGGATSSTAVPQ